MTDDLHAERARLKNNKTLLDYIAYFERLSPRTIRLIEKLAVPGLRFKDPFNDVRGTDAVERLFEHMFASVDRPKFKIVDYAWSRDNMRAYLRWDFSCERKGAKHLISGMSEISFDQDGLVASHIDYWDSGEYFFAKLTVIGAVIRWVQGKLKVS